MRVHLDKGQGLGRQRRTNVLIRRGITTRSEGRLRCTKVNTLPTRRWQRRPCPRRELGLERPRSGRARWRSNPTHPSQALPSLEPPAAASTSTTPDPLVLGCTAWRRSTAARDGGGAWGSRRASSSAFKSKVLRSCMPRLHPDGARARTSSHTTTLSTNYNI